MPKSVTIKLKNPIVGHGGQVTEVTLREPKGFEYVELGEPISYAMAKDGLVVHAQNNEAIKGYLGYCLSAQGADALLFESQLSLVDAMAIKAALLDFFGGAQSQLAKPSASSSPSASSAPTAPAA